MVKKISTRAAVATFASLIDEMVVLIVLLIVLPALGFHIPLHYVITILALFAAFSYWFYRLMTPVIDRKPQVGPEALLGAIGRATTPLNPEGYVKIESELWKATSLGGHVDQGEKVVVEGVNGLTVFVRRLGEATKQSSQ